MAPQLSPARATAALVALSLAAFAYVTAELLPIGLLTIMAPDLDRSRSAIGLLVTGYAFVVVLMSLPLARLTQHIPRRRLLTVTLALFAASTVVSALADSYAVLAVARLVTALTQALFWSVVGSTVTGLFPPAVRGRIVARFSVGPALAPVLGVPVGTWLGQQAGWRAAFLATAAVVVVIGVVVTLTVPSFPPRDGGAARGTAPNVRSYRVLLAITTLGVTGFLTVQTYITPFLLDVSGFAPESLAPLLFVSGAAGVLGTIAIGRILDSRPVAALGIPLTLIATSLLGLYLFGVLRPVTVALVAVCGLAFSAMAAAVQGRTLQVAPGNTDLASAGSGTAFNIGIAAGSLIGGALLPQFGSRPLALVGGALALAALAVVAVDRRSSRVDHGRAVDGSAPSGSPSMIDPEIVRAEGGSAR